MSAITLIVQLVSKPEMTVREAEKHIAQHFPDIDADAFSLSADVESGIVRLTIHQDKLTDAQRDWLHMTPFAARYIDSYTVEEMPEAKQMEQWQLEALQKLLGTDVSELEAGQRVYTSSSTYGNSRYHLIDKRYDGVQIEQVEIDEKWSKRINLYEDEVPALLKTLLAWHLEGIRNKGEDTFPDHPF